MTEIIAREQASIKNYFGSLEPAIDPNARPIFLLDWEITLKCNLDCSYCSDNPDTPGGHWTKARHPPLNECLKTIDFMFEYADLYMQYKARWSRTVVLNVYGGESLLHPDIVEILKTVKEKYKKYQDRWPLKVTCTTNATLGTTRFTEVCDYIDEFTFSYHCESLPKHKQAYKKNALIAKEKNKNLKCIILMHQDHNYWPELFDIIEFCKEHGLNYLPRHLDGDRNSNYNPEQIQWFKDLYVSKSKNSNTQKDIIASDRLDGDTVNLAKTGRACCGGRSVCVDQDYKNSVFYVVGNNFHGWHCAVNWMFLFIKQNDGKIFTNKDCRMNFDNTVAPIGNLKDSQKLLNWTRKQLESKTMPVIECQKNKCLCGLCAPKALTKSKFSDIIKKHVTENVFAK